MADQRFSSSAFSPAAPRQTSVALLRNVGTGDHRVVTSISTRKRTEVLRIDPRTGRLELENDRWAESSYENESEALDHLHGKGYELVERGYALLGYAVAGPTAGLLLATRVREKAVLPGGHTVFAVTDSQWVSVPLQNEAADAATAAALAGLPAPKAVAAAQEFWRTLQQFTLNNAHYYCETADISRPFPSAHDPREPNLEFVWNSWLRQPLAELGLYDLCPVLLQGAVECSTQALPGGSRFSMCLISRRSRRHPGTRYIARGLNSMAGPGNEIECELVTWTHPEQRQYGAGAGPGSSSSDFAGGGGFTSTSFTAAGAASGGADGSSSGGGGGEALRWARVVWRRGTVPIWWGVQLQSLAQGLQAEVYVKEEHPYQGTASYFRNVQRQHVPHPALAACLPGGQQQAGEAAAEGGGGAGGGGADGWTLVDGSGNGGAAPEGGAGGSAHSGSAAAAAAARAGGSSASAAGGQQGGGKVDEELLSQAVAVTCINLLHANPKKASELMLSSHFQDAMRHVRRRLGSEAPIKVVNFDWHGNMGRLSEEKAVEGFWSLMEPFVKQTGFAFGWMEPEPGRSPSPASQTSSSSAPAAAAPAAGAAAGPLAAAGAAGGLASSAAPATAWPPAWRMRWGAQQRGLLRFNCADSLDRTNAATCFAMLPVLQEQLRVLGITLECASQPATAALLRARQRSSAGDVAALERQGQGPQGPEAALPEGWEVRQHDGRLLYIDHINKTTQWTPPPSPAGTPASLAGGPGSRPSSASTPLSSRMIQSASDMLARLQQRSAAPGSGAGGGGGAGGAGASPAKGTPLAALERRSSPPRVAPDGSGGGHYWSRNSSSSSLNGSAAAGGAGSAAGGAGGMVPHAASAPDVTLPSTRASTATSEAPSSPGAQDRDPRRPWAFFEYDINDVRERLYKDAVSDYVEMFRVHGDIHSFLYTGSPAMHSHVLNLVVQGGKGYGATSGVGKLQNLRVAVQRRWNNTVSDTSRQQAMELFLGLRIADAPDQKGYFPGLQLGYADPTQSALGGLEPFEFAPLPPSHSRHTSASLPGMGPLGAGAATADALAASLSGASFSGSRPSSAAPRQPVVFEEQEAGEEAGGPAGGQAGGSVDSRRYAGDDRAHAVPGVHAVEHDGVLGVRQDLIDLEPFAPDDTPSDGSPSEQQQAQQQDQEQQFAPAPQQQQHGGEHSPGRHREASRLGPHHAHSSSSVESAGPASGGGSVHGAGPSSAPAFDPLGAVLHPDAEAAPTQQQQQAGASTQVASQLDDLLL